MSKIQEIPKQEMPEPISIEEKFKMISLRAEVMEIQVQMLQLQDRFKTKAMEFDKIIKEQIGKNPGWVLDRDLNWVKEN